MKPKSLNSLNFSSMFALKGLSHEMDLAFDDMYGMVSSSPKIGDGPIF